MLEKLKEYKEVITIIVFFLGGFAWFENTYPKKADLETGKKELKSEISNLDIEMTRLNCMLYKYMTLTQHQLSVQELEKQIDKLKKFIEMFKSGDESLLSPAMKSQREEYSKEIAEKKESLNKTIIKIDVIRKDLEKNVCGGSSP